MNYNTKFLIGAHGSTASSSATTASFDTLGFSFARIICVNNIADSITASTANKVEEGDTTSSYATFAGVVHGVDWSSNTASASTSQARIIYNIDLRGRKRYLKCSFQSTALSDPAPSIFCELSDVGDSARTVSATSSASNQVGF